MSDSWKEIRSYEENAGELSDDELDAVAGGLGNSPTLSRAGATSGGETSSSGTTATASGGATGGGGS
jgi:hypothetical protein